MVLFFFVVLQRRGCGIGANLVRCRSFTKLILFSILFICPNSFYNHFLTESKKVKNGSSI